MSVMSDLRGSNIGPDVKMKTLVLGRRQVEELLGMAEALRVVEDALRLKAQGKTVMPPKIYLDLPAYPENTMVSLPSVLATIILCDPKTSFPLAIMDGAYITNMRTGTAGGAAVKYLARKNSKVVGIWE
jgi:alanine dehydrogenase